MPEDNRDQVNRLMRELRQQHPEIRISGERRYARYFYEASNENS
jgi:hypothetical protein